MYVSGWNTINVRVVRPPRRETLVKSSTVTTTPRNQNTENRDSVCTIDVKSV